MPTTPFHDVLNRLDLVRHLLVVGKTGSGKSTLLRALATEIARSGSGFLLVDPHGDLAEAVLGDVPRQRRNDVALFNAADPKSCPGLNPLRTVPEEQRALVVSNILATMRKIWPEFWGPRTEHVLRHVLLAIMEMRGATFEDARSMLVDEKRRGQVLRQVKESHVRAFWVEEFATLDKRLASEVTAPILNKLGALLASGVVREIVTKSRPRLDARKLIERASIVVAALPKGRIGEDATLLLGGLLLGAFQHATMARAEVPAEKRRPFFLLVDEVGSFATPPLLELVAEARKFGVGLVLATQSLAAMDESVRAALLGNVGTLVSFRVGADDAEIVSREFIHEFAAQHLMRLAIGEMVVRSGAARPVVIPPLAT